MFNVEEFIDDMDVKAFLLFQVPLVVTVSLKKFSTMIEMVSNTSQLVDPTVGIWVNPMLCASCNLLLNKWSTPSISWTLHIFLLQH